MDLLRIALGRKLPFLLMCSIVNRVMSVLLCATEACFPEAELTTFDFCSRKIKKLLLELDSYGGPRLDRIFPFFFFS